MATEDYAFYEDQRTEPKRRCVDGVVPLASSYLRFSRHAQPLSCPTSTYTSSSLENTLPLFLIVIVIQIVLHHKYLRKQFLYHKIAT